MAWSLPERGVLGIFGKRPEPGRVKTRLAEALGAERASAIAGAMLFDALEAWSPAGPLVAPGGRVVLVYDPPDAGPWFDPRVPAELALQPQSEGDLGQRLAGFFAGEFADGRDSVVVIGADSPTLDPAFVVSAFLLLEHKDAVLGPAADGGFVLLGLRPPFDPAWLDDIAWSTADVLGQTVDRLTRAGRTVALLPPWYDVDTPDDWRMLQGHARAMRAAGRHATVGPRLAALLQAAPADKP